MLRRFNHVAFRCKDAVETVDFYTRVVGLDFSHALVGDVVPSVKMYCPFIHIFFELDDGSSIAFFETPTVPPAVPDPNTPAWVQHIAFDVADNATLLKGKERLECHGIEVLGPVDHGEAHSIYFFDPNGHRLEFTHWLDHSPESHERNRREAMPVLQKWQERKARDFVKIDEPA